MIEDFTGRIYRCPKCGAEMDGYIEDTCDGTEEWAGCDRCLEGWKASELRDITKERIIFT
jgi:hypothetical protein